MRAHNAQCGRAAGAPEPQQEGFVSNNSRHSMAKLEHRFSRLGFCGVRGEQVFSSVLCSMLFLQQRLLFGSEAGAARDPSASPPGPVFILDGEGLCGELWDLGLCLVGEEEEPQEGAPVCAVLISYDNQFSFAKLSEACTYLHDLQCLLVATNPDHWQPLNDGQCTPS
ncbi:UNVERIFIED_CONTAM: hypothetical protein K2H54_074685 [Gekko kuhli]